MNKVRRLAQVLGPAGPGLLFAIGGPALGLLVLTAMSADWLPWFTVDLESELLFVGIGAMLAAFCLVPTHATSVLAGYLFGTLHGIATGFLLVLVAAAIGFEIWSRLVGDKVINSIAKVPQAKRVHGALLRRGNWRSTWLIALLRVSPVMPFAATNILMASFGVRFWVFMLATAIGIAPRCIAAAVVGAELSSLDWDVSGGKAYTVVAVVATVVVLLAICGIARAALQREITEFETTSERE